MTTLPNPRADARATQRHGVLSLPVRAAFRAAVARCIEAEDGNQVATQALRSEVRAARAEKINAEYVVAMIRTMWYETYPKLRPTVDHDLKLVHLIRTALDAYFAEADDPQPLPHSTADR